MENTLSEEAMMDLKITGRIAPSGGEGKAHVNYKAMIPVAALHCPEIASCDKYGTINVEQLAPPLRKSHADCWTPQVIWEPIVDAENLGRKRPEAFGFIKIGFECPLGTPLYDAWIIMPSGHGYSYEDTGVEIIASMWIPGANPGVPCAIHLDHKPLKERPAIFNWPGSSYVPGPGSVN
jgi:hypothetical protein